MIPARVVLIADRLSDRSHLSLHRADLELAEDDYYLELLDALRAISKGVTTYETPQAFLNAIGRHRSDVVLSIWSGQHSRNRKALVPSICEAYGIPYVGGDTYTQLVAQDKDLSKGLCRRFGLTTPPAILIESPDEFQLLESIRYPLVVKPNREGGSIGISRANLVSSTAEAKEMVQRLLLAGYDGVLAEEFVPGREICYVLLGDSKGVHLAEAVELLVAGAPLTEPLWSYEIKQSETVEHQWRLITHDLSESVRANGIRLFRALGKVEILRIDGRLDEEGVFHAIELSPDAHLGTAGAVAAAAVLKGIPYVNFVEHLLVTALQNH